MNGISFFNFKKSLKDKFLSFSFCNLYSKSSKILKNPIPVSHSITSKIQFFELESSYATFQTSPLHPSVNLGTFSISQSMGIKS